LLDVPGFAQLRECVTGSFDAFSHTSAGYSAGATDTGFIRVAVMSTTNLQASCIAVGDSSGRRFRRRRRRWLQPR